MHLIVLIHGMWGNPSHFDYVVDQLKAKGAVSHDSGLVPDLQGVKTVVYRTSTNQGYFTYDGIDICGLRVADEIKTEIKAIASTGQPVKEISILGYSMGGIIARYAIGVLEQDKVFENISTRAFTTMFSPHLGVRVLKPGFGPSAFNLVGSWSMARTSRQVFLQDKYHNRGAPLFLYLTSQGTPYVDALKRFKSRTLYANIINDRRCEFYTAAAEISDPYEGRQSLLEGPFIEGYGPTLVAPEPPKFAAPTPAPQAKSILHKIARIVPLVFKVTVTIPAWFCAFIINAVYQTAVSTLRTVPIVRSGRLMDIDVGASSNLDRLLEDEANSIVDDMYQVVDRSSKLEVTPEVRLIHKQFNELDWKKVYVHITADKNAHSAAIHRWNTPSFYEGKLVIKHWVNEVLGL